MKSKLLVVTFGSQILLALTNTSIAIVLARRFGGSTFNDYLAIVSICSGLAIVTKGIQTVTALEYVSNSSIRVAQGHGDKQAFLYGLALLTFWALLSPLVAKQLGASIWATLGGGLILFSGALGSRAGGKFQGLSLFEMSQKAVLLVSLLQIPLVLVALLFKAPLSVFIGLLSVPSIVLFLFARNFLTEVKPGLIEKRSSHLVQSSISAAITSVLFQIPLLFLASQFPTTTLGGYTALIFVYSIGVNLSSILGSFLLPKFVGSAHKSNWFGFTKHLYAVLPLLSMTLFCSFGGTRVFTSVLGPTYSVDLPLQSSLAISSSYLIWALTSSLIQERLASTRDSKIIFLFMLLLAEISIFRVSSLTPVSYFIIHGLVGLITVLIIVRNDI